MAHFRFRDACGYRARADRARPSSRARDARADAGRDPPRGRPARRLPGEPRLVRRRGVRDRRPGRAPHRPHGRRRLATRRRAGARRAGRRRRGQRGAAGALRLRRRRDPAPLHGRTARRSSRSTATCRTTCRSRARPSRPATRSACSARRPRTAAGSRTCTSSCSRRWSAWAPASTASRRRRSSTCGSRSAPTRTCCCARRRARPTACATRDDIRRRRRTNLSRALSISYREPLEIVRGERAYLYDADGNAWLDLVNNVCHVGHAHPRVTAAMAGQAAVAEHEHALPAPDARHLRAAARRDAARPALGRVPDQLRLRGERPRAAPRARPHRPPRRARAGVGATTATSRR